MAFVWPLLVIGVLIVAVEPVIGYRCKRNDRTTEATPLVNGAEELWTELPQTLHFKAYFFEIQNPDNVHTGLEYPVVKEKGPYVYRQSKWKNNIQFSDDNLTVSFDVYRKYEFDQEASGDLKDTDEIYIMNPVMNSILQTIEMDDTMKHNLMAANGLLSRVFNNTTNFFLKTTPREALFSGIEFCVNPTGAAIQLCQTILSFALEVDYIEKTEDRLSFAFYRHRETKPEGHYVVNTGISDSSLTNIIEKFNGDDKLHVWLNDNHENGEGIITSTCNELFGSFGNRFPPFPNKYDPLTSFQTDICRAITSYYVGEAKYQGISGVLYRIGKDFVEDIGPQFGNQCFCVNRTQGIDQTQENGCLFSGALDLFNCLNLPFIMTKPHMLDADETYTTNINGLEPDNAKHDSMMIIEPYTRILLQGFTRIQLNAFLRPIFRITKSSSFKPVLMPLLWIDESIELNDKMSVAANKKFSDRSQLSDTQHH